MCCRFGHGRSILLWSQTTPPALLLRSAGFRSAVFVVRLLQPAQHFRIHFLGGSKADLEFRGLVDFRGLQAAAGLLSFQAKTLKGVSFPRPGIFLVELLLDNQWVADTSLELK